MVVLKSMDEFDKLAELDTSTGHISWLSRRADPTAASRRIQGAIAQLSGRTLCLYRESGVLHFRVDNEDFELTAQTRIKIVHLDDDVNCIIVLRNGVSLFTWAYRRPTVDPPIEYDPTLFVEEEDFDFCLFVHNVANDPGRQERIFAADTDDRN